MEPSQKSSLMTLPGAIIVAGALIAAAIFWNNKPANNKDTANAIQKPQNTEINMREVSTADHILGNPNAPIKIVEYSDPSCPYCKMFNPIMEQVMTDYGASGKVAWIYRHFPLDKPGTRSDGGILHKNAGHESEAMECAASLGGNDKFWAYEKRLYEVTPSVTGDHPDGLDQKQLPEIAKYIGLDPVAFNECLTSDQFKNKVEADYQDGINAGISGTPTSILITPSGTKIPLVGMEPYQTLKTSIDALLAEKSAK